VIVLRYPVSINVVKKLKCNDIVKYSGKLVLLSEESLKKLVSYKELEGSYPYDLIGEIILTAYWKEFPIFFNPSEEFLENIFSMGAVGVILELRERNLSILRKLSRVVFKPLDEIKGSVREVLYKELSEKALREIWVDGINLKVILDSKGKYVKSEVKG